MKIGLDDQIKCVEREIAMRERLYPRLVRWGPMEADRADQELAAMRAVLETLKAVQETIRRAMHDAPPMEPMADTVREGAP